MASTELKRTISSAGSQTKWGASAWVKRCDLGLSAGIYCSSKSDTTQNNRGIFFNSSDQIECAFYNGGYTYQVVTNRKFRDTNAWYHVVVNLDTSQSTAEDRIKIWVNGVQETSMATSNYPSQNSTHNFLGTDITQLVGSLREGSSIHHSCVISHLYFTDGYCYPASTFGSTDSTTGEWKIDTSPTIANYGTNGFFILKDGNSVTDQSGQGNNLTVSAGTLTKTEDCPSNVFGTFNPLHIQSGRALTMSNGNGKIASNQNNWQPIGCTLAVPPKTGKWYWEFSQFIEAQTFVGFISSECNININLPYQATDGMITYFYAGRLTNDGSETESYFTAISATTDVVGVALDMTAGTHGQVQFYLNGSPTGSAVALGSSFANQFVMPFAMCNGTGGRSVSINTGNGYFGTTAVSSAGTNASGNGIFEYDVPTGYTALSTKGLNE